MKAVLFFIVVLNIITIASASEWEEHNAILKWGESVSVSGYNITAMDFRPGTVEEITNKTKCIIEPDPYKRKIWGCDDYVFLTVFKNGDHVLDAALTERNHTFVDGAEFFNETVYKEGDSSLKITALEVITGKYIPTPYAKLRILVKNNELELEFDIAGNFAIVKTVPAEAHVNPLSEFIPVSITVKNTGAYDFSYIWVNDSTPEGFISKPQEPGWGIPLKKGEIWQEEYLIKPLKPVAGKKYTLPPAALYVVYNNRTYNLSTGNISFILRSSEIIVTKTADKTEVRGTGNVTVNISVKNNGSRAAQVKVRDSIIPDMEVVSGELNFSIVLQPDGSYNNSYILKLNNVSDNISLPYARFDFKEYWSEYDPETQSQANTGSGISNPVEIKFGSTSTQEKASASTQENNTSAVAPLAEKPSTDDSSMEDSSNSSGEDIPAETMPSDILKKASSLWISIQQLPYAVLALMAGGLLAVLMLRIWRPEKDQDKGKQQKR